MTYKAAIYVVTAFFHFMLIMPVMSADLRNASPSGSWVSSDGQVRVSVSLCGDGTQLCARLTGLSGNARSSDNLPLLNTLVLNSAVRSGLGTWRGVVHFNGASTPGKITFENARTVTLSGCRFGVCKSIEFNRS
ncbi:MAG: hypothetical protein JWN11_1545 [Hyphomicrobiales bacterium]|nr:hypothetical protein [Hyphomicrobiales bacterium]